VPRGAHSSPITIQQKQSRKDCKGDGRFESKYLKAKADLKANIRKQLSDLKAKVVECQCLFLMLGLNKDKSVKKVRQQHDAW
jgi:hypothetical protein